MEGLSTRSELAVLGSRARAEVQPYNTDNNLELGRCGFFDKETIPGHFISLFTFQYTLRRPRAYLSVQIVLSYLHKYIYCIWLRLDRAPIGSSGLSSGLGLKT